MKKLTEKQIASFCVAHPGWRSLRNGAYIEKMFETRDYVSGLMLVTRIAIHAEIKDHHPDMTLAYGKVTVRLATHSAKGVTGLDTDLAQTIDELAAL